MLALVASRLTCRHSRSTALFTFSPARTFTGSALRFDPTRTKETIKKSGSESPGRPRAAAKPTAKASSNKPSKTSKQPKRGRPGKPKKAPPRKILRLWTPPPKRSLSAICIFSTEKATSIGGFAHLKDVGAEYNALSDEEKSTYTTRAREETAKRREAYKAWRASLSPAALRQYNSWHRAKAAKRLAQRAEETGTATLKRPASSYILFFQEYFPKHYPSHKAEGKPAYTVLQAAGQAWRNMTLGEKAPYIAQAEENTKVYQRKKLHMMEEKLHEQASALT